MSEDGPAGGGLVGLLHDGFGDPRAWGRFGEQLRDRGLTVSAPSLRYLTDAPSRAAWAADGAATTGPCDVVVTHGDAVAIAAVLAGRGQIETVVAIDPPPTRRSDSGYDQDDALTTAAGLMPLYAPYTDELASGSFASSRAAALARDLTRDEETLVRPDDLALLRQVIGDAFVQSFGAALARADALFGPDGVRWEQRLAETAVRVVVVSTSATPAATRAAYDAFADGGSRARHVSVDLATRYPWLAAPDRIGAIVEDAVTS